MTLIRRVAATALATLALAVPASAAATISVNPAISYSGQYTLSWTDAVTSSTWPRTLAYLASSFNGGAWEETLVKTSSVAMTSMASGSYAYKLRVYALGRYQTEMDFRYETNVVTVLVTRVAPGTPISLDTPPANLTGSYVVNWGPASSGAVERYELYENGAVVFSGPGLWAPETPAG